MRKTLTSLFVLCSGFFAKSQSTQTFHDFSVANIAGDTISLSSFAGKKLLVVNTASFCGYTPQFAKLQRLDSIYGGEHFRVIGFPCNDFSNQDPNSDSVIYEYCTGLYGVTFPMMAKVKIVTGDTVPVYKWLQRANLNGVANASVSWNFNKFLIDENGHWVRHFDAPTLPTDTAITNWITSTSSTAGITNLNSSDFKIIKNQAKGEILIELPTNFPIHFTTSLTNMQGQVVKKINSIRAGSSSTFNISVSDLSSGIYYLNLKANAGAYIAKVVVEE